MQTVCVEGESPTRHVAEGRVDKVHVVVVTNKKKKASLKSSAANAAWFKVLQPLNTHSFATPPPLQKTTQGSSGARGPKCVKICLN